MCKTSTVAPQTLTLSIEKVFLCCLFVCERERKEERERERERLSMCENELVIE